MTESKHTKGPWHCGEQDHNWRSIFGPEGCGRMHAEEKGSTLYPIAWVVRDEHTQEETDRANARLIAAAPELLAALESVLASVPFADYRGDGELEECEAQVKAALAKAGR